MFAYPSAPPTICVGELQLSAGHRQQADQLRQQWLASGGYCERQAVCLTPLLPAPYQPSRLAIALTDYAAIHLLRQQGTPVMSVTAGAIFHYQSRFILLKRAPHLHLFPDCYGPFGGHYCPDQPDLGFGVWIDTLHAELLEETGLLFEPEWLAAQAGQFCIEPQTGALFWFVLIELETDQMQHLRTHQSIEGQIVQMDRIALEQTTEDQWSALGWQLRRVLLAGH